SPFWCGLSGAPGCVTWELILDGYSESSYSATPRFAAARLPWFSNSSATPLPTTCDGQVVCWAHWRSIVSTRDTHTGTTLRE
ncbi:hypothetical protein, partial [Escherichia coli]|uniref:hypothetical protein n=1 Tax=Escherichia coli TaxID=562 RepID=UPI00201CCABC